MQAIINGKIVLEDMIIDNQVLLIHQNSIYKIIEEDELDDYKLDQIIDAYGGYITPGFIDIHSDYIEKIAAPRKASVMDMELAVNEFEKECCTHGITTMFHSITVSEDAAIASPMRQTENIKKLIDVIEKSHSELHLIHNRFHLRFEIDNFKQFDMMMDYLRKDSIHLLSFMDHTPGQGQYRNLEIYKQAYLRDKHNNDEDKVNEELHMRMNHERITLDKIKEAVDLALEKGISVASHDDDTIEKLDVVQGMGIEISEFPITLEVAKEAKRRGMYTVVGAPNILLGGSHSGNMSARDAIEAGCVDILCSDYYPAALLHSVFMMEKYGQRLEDMIAMVTIHPARAAKIDHITGSIELGKMADLLIIMKLPNELPVITHVFVEGQLTQQNHYRISEVHHGA